MKLFQLEDGDVLLFKLARSVSDAERSVLTERLNGVFPSNRMLVTDADVEIEVLRQPEPVLGTVIDITGEEPASE